MFKIYSVLASMVALTHTCGLNHLILWLRLDEHNINDSSAHLISTEVNY